MPKPSMVWADPSKLRNGNRIRIAKSCHYPRAPRDIVVSGVLDDAVTRQALAEERFHSLLLGVRGLLAMHADVLPAQFTIEADDLLARVGDL